MNTEEFEKLVGPLHIAEPKPSDLVSAGRGFSVTKCPGMPGQMYFTRETPEGLSFSFGSLQHQVWPSLTHPN